MHPLERQIAERYPHWFRGRRARLTQPLLRTLGRWSKLDQAYAFLADHGHLQGLAFVDAAIDHLNLRPTVEPEGERRIPAQGRLLIVANHPSGALDALALLQLVGRVRRDVRIVANDFLMDIAPLAELLLPVRILGGAPGVDSVRAVERALEAEQCVIVFPAGEVSRLGPRGVRDTRWRRGFLRFARATGAPVLPIRVQARNSPLFYGASALFKPAGTALLAREMFRRSQRRLHLHVGQVLRVDAEEAAVTVIERVRSALYALGRPAKAASPEPADTAEPLVGALAPDVLAACIDTLDVLGETTDGKRICVGRLAGGSPLLREIGRLRELTFRAVGEGTGKRMDVDAFDTWYEHIVLWDAAQRKIAGAYRIARGAPVLAAQGLKGLYTASLFDYADDALPRLAAGMELGRSFVVPEYWGSRSIDYLWQGIGAYLRRHPRVRYLFGAVSMSAALPLDAREQIVAYYAHYYGDPSGEARSRHPFRYTATPPCFDALDAETAFRVLKTNLDTLGATVPMLYKQYTDLCEPGGARFLAFGVDPDFSDSLDGLIEVDLHRIRPRKRERYLGDAWRPVEAAA
ncbi:lysophospholipid acyltransferase family protein [Pseudoxanthomonas sp. LH2527]|uniref:lysophospholipid acyltransferase family protein n=1 Tax=Pseudoxanthomonas sp. LH2527 TaxID=2923249 RepID=UPI001F13084F|nr:GNAT family N-acyltransferase [Pseudoxanthomonas sp. LH2527]MCH6482300.1 lysophospholipid acyltransferase family protein [Pseudoxanthomonas sp. LH2527]